MGFIDFLNKNIPCLLSRKTAFISMTLLLGSFFIVEIIVGYFTNSMALIADSFHMLSDVASLVVGYLALRYSTVKAPRDRYTFGYVRAEVLGATVNAVFLVALCFSIFIEAVKRLVILEGIEDPILVLAVGATGLVVNAFGMFLFYQQGHAHHGHGGSHGHSHGGLSHGHSHGSETKKPEKESDPGTKSTDEKTSPKSAIKSGSQLNIAGVYLHILGDALGSVIVMISALIIMFAHGTWTLYVDPAMSIIMVLIILKTSIPLLKETTRILMQTVPTHIQMDEIKKRLRERIPGILNIHEFHVWQLAGDKIIASAHVKFFSVQDYMATANDIKDFFHQEGIHSTTIQLEFEKEDDPQGARCMVVCRSDDDDCADKSCCSDELMDPQ